MSVDAISALVRALSFIALFQAAGVAMFIAIFDGQIHGALSSIRRAGFASAIGGVALVSLHYALEAARMAGALSGTFDLSLQRLAFDSPMSAAWGTRTAGLVMIAVAIRREGGLWTSLSVAGAALTIAAFLFVGHTAGDTDRGWLAALLSVHLAVVAFWFGALAPLYIVSRKESPLAAGAVIAGFSRLASWIVPGILIAGVLITIVLVDRWAVFAESYGAILLAKVAAFAVLMSLAALNKWRYGAAIATAPHAAISFRRTVAAEYLLICAVLSATAVMTTFFSPEQ